MIRAFDVRRLGADDAAAWVAMRTMLFPADDPGVLAGEIAQLLADDKQAAFAAVAPDGTLVGFVEAGERCRAEGATSSPVAYVEALWVQASVRRRGIARLLIGAVKDWASQRGCSELGSDADIANEISHAVHARLGFAETNRLVTFLMGLDRS